MKYDGKNAATEKLAISIIAGFMVGLIFDQLALGMVGGVMVGCLLSAKKSDKK